MAKALDPLVSALQNLHSSNDFNRVVRMDYGGDVFFAQLADSALTRWRTWNAEALGTIVRNQVLLIRSDLIPLLLTSRKFDVISGNW